MPITFARIVAFSRTVHIYVTLFALLLMMFFAITGFLLNHEEWLGIGTPQTREVQGEIPTTLLGEPDRLLVVERLRADFGAQGAVRAFDTEDKTIRIEFNGPGRRTDAEIERATGKTVVQIESRGALARLDDLHRGGDAGSAWRFVIDASAVFLFLGSLTGFVMWFSLPRRRTLGIVALVASVLLCAGVYLALVP